MNATSLLDSFTDLLARRRAGSTSPPTLRTNTVAEAVDSWSSTSIDVRLPSIGSTGSAKTLSRPHPLMTKSTTSLESGGQCTVLRTSDSIFTAMNTCCLRRSV